MDSGLVGAGIWLVVVVIIVVFSLLATVLSLLIPIGIAVYVMRQIQAGNFVVVSPMSVAGPPQPRATDPTFVKRTTCRSCGSPQVRPSKAAYVYCEYCGELMDWDFQAAISDKRSKLPGPAYEALLRQLGPELASARQRQDAVAYEAVQKRVFDAYAKAAPAGLSPRIGDERYRDAIVSFMARSQTVADFDPACQATFSAQNAATQALVWDRSNPFSPRAEPASFHRLLDAVMAHQRQVVSTYEEKGLLETHPDRPTADLMVRMGLSAMCQGWIPFLPPAEVDAMLAKTGLKDEYGKVEPPVLKSGPCPSCAAPLEVVEGSKRVLCHHCGHLAAVGGGTLPCHGCGTKVTIPADTRMFRCPSCDAELRRMAWS